MADSLYESVDWKKFQNFQENVTSMTVYRNKKKFAKLILKEPTWWILYIKLRSHSVNSWKIKAIIYKYLAPWLKYEKIGQILKLAIGK